MAPNEWTTQTCLHFFALINSFTFWVPSKFSWLMDDYLKLSRSFANMQKLGKHFPWCSNASKISTCHFIKNDDLDNNEGLFLNQNCGCNVCTHVRKREAQVTAFGETGTRFWLCLSEWQCYWWDITTRGLGSTSKAWPPPRQVANCLSGSVGGGAVWEDRVLWPTYWRHSETPAENLKLVGWTWQRTQR